MKKFKNKHVFTVLGGVIVVLILFFAYTNYKGESTRGGEPYRATLSGVEVCLPHKDTSGAQTLECIAGLKTDSGDYYALNFDMMSQTRPNIPIGVHFTATGLVTPAESLSTDMWQKYNMKGIFSVTDSVVVNQ